MKSRPWMAVLLITTLLLAPFKSSGILLVNAAESDDLSHDGWLFMLTEDAPAPMLLMGAIDPPVQSVDSELGIYRADSPEYARMITAEENIVLIEPNYMATLFESPFVPNDTFYASHQATYMNLIKAHAAWESGLNGHGVRVAVIDSGLVENHEDLHMGHVVPGSDFTLNPSNPPNTLDRMGHGSFVSGVIAARTSNNKGVASLAEGVTLLPIKIFDVDEVTRAKETTTYAMIIDALSEAREMKADIINMSFGGGDVSAALETAINTTANAGIIMIAAVGNDGLTTPMYPAAYDKVIGVGSVRHDGILSDFSRINSSVYVTAPGESITSIGNQDPNSYLTGNGTSYSTPMVVGLAALARQAKPNLTLQQFKDMLSSTSRNPNFGGGGTGYDTSYGYGIINAEALLAHATLPLRHRITWDLNGGTLDPNITVPFAYTASSRATTLPNPVRDGYLFDGWYLLPADPGTPAVAPERVLTLPVNSGRSFTLQAKWDVTEATDTTISSVTVRGFKAQANGVNNFSVALPLGYNRGDILATEVSFIPRSGSATVSTPVSTIEGEIWTTTVTSGNSHETETATVTVSISANAAPVPAGGTTRTISSADFPIAPASLDGNIPAQPYQVNLNNPSDWFTDNDGPELLTYHLLDKTVTGNVTVDGSWLTVTPGPLDAGKNVTLRITAYDGQFYSSEAVLLTLPVGLLPPSQSTLSPATSTFDRRPGSAGHLPINVDLQLYGNTLQKISIGDTVLQAGTDYTFTLFAPIISGTEASPVSSSADASVRLLTSWLSTLPVGEHLLSLSFSVKESRSLMLTITESPAPPPPTSAAAPAPAPGPAPGPPPPPPAAPPPPPEDLFMELLAEDSSVKVAYTQTGGETTLLFETDTLKAFLDHAVMSGSLQLNVSAVSGTDTLTFPASALTAISRAVSTNSSLSMLTIMLPDVTVTLDAEALSSISRQVRTGSVTFTARQAQADSLTRPQEQASAGRPVYSLRIGGEAGAVATFNGTLAWTLPYRLATGESSSGLVIWYLDPSGRRDSLPATYNTRLRQVSFAVPHLSLFAIGYEPILTWRNPFTDVKSDAWYHDSVRYVNWNGLFSGTSLSSFSPSIQMSRAMFVTVLHRITGTPEPDAPAQDFPDVKDGQWYTDAILWATSNGIAARQPDGLFGISVIIPREEMALLLWRHAGKPDTEGLPSEALSVFPDAGFVSNIAQKAMAWAVDTGLILGKGSGQLDPQGLSTRAEVATILMRYAEHLEQ